MYINLHVRYTNHILHDLIMMIQRCKCAQCYLHSLSLQLADSKCPCHSLITLTTSLSSCHANANHYSTPPLIICHYAFHSTTTVSGPASKLCRRLRVRTPSAIDQKYWQYVPSYVQNYRRIQSKMEEMLLTCWASLTHSCYSHGWSRRLGQRSLWSRDNNCAAAVGTCRLRRYVVPASFSF